MTGSVRLGSAAVRLTTPVGLPMAPTSPSSARPGAGGSQPPGTGSFSVRHGPCPTPGRPARGRAPRACAARLDRGNVPGHPRGRFQPAPVGGWVQWRAVPRLSRDTPAGRRLGSAAAPASETGSIRTFRVQGAPHAGHCQHPHPPGTAIRLPLPKSVRAGGH